MKAVILSAGYGTRLRPLTDSVTKPMVKVLGIPAIEYTLNFLKTNGINEVFINRHYFPEQFESINTPSGMKITFSFEQDILGTLGGVMSFKDDLMDDDFIVINGDIIFNFDLKQAYHTHRSKNNVATMLLRDNDVEKASPVYIDDFLNVVSIGKREDDVYKSYMFSGIHIISPDFFNKVNIKDAPSCMVRDFYIPYMKNGGRVSAFVPAEPFLWMEIGDLTSYLKANIRLVELMSRYKLDHEMESFISAYWFNSKQNKILESVEGIWLGEGYYIDHDATIHPPVIIGAGTKVMSNCVVGPNAVIGNNVIIMPDSQIKDSLILDEVKVSPGDFVEQMIIGKDFLFNAQERLIN